MNTASPSMHLRREAETIAASFPGLLAEAERVAAIVAQGVHGRRRAGQGESFWQFRRYDPTDGATAIDWRRSARSDHLYVRENEWEAANAVWVWRDGTARMDWRSSNTIPTKKDRASVLIMALVSLLIRGGERCAVLGRSERPRTGRAGLEKVTHTLAASSGTADALAAELPRHAGLILASDFLEGADVWATRLAQLAARPARGVLIHVIDPAEEDFPFSGRLKLELPGTAHAPLLIGRAERNAASYRQEFAAHKDAMSSLARRLDWPIIVHRTDQPANLAVAALYNVIAEGLS